MKHCLSFILAFVAIALVTTSCGDKHLISDAAYRAIIEKDLQKKMDCYPEGNLFDVFNRTDLSLAEREALAFLYAYMPLSDMTDYSGDFHLMNIRASLKTQQEMSWGKQVPELLFRHFVLPERINREA